MADHKHLRVDETGDVAVIHFRDRWLKDFDQLEELVKEVARQGEIHLSFDLKPEYLDTPRRWQDRRSLTCPLE